MVLPLGCVGGICAFQARPVRAIFAPPLWVVLGSGLRRAAACGCSGVLGRQTRPRRAAGPGTSYGPCLAPAWAAAAAKEDSPGSSPWAAAASEGEPGNTIPGTPSREIGSPPAKR